MYRIVFRSFFLLLCITAALVPLTTRSPVSFQATRPDWPIEFESAPLYPLPMSKMEERFSAGFPGAVARFTDGRRQFIFRWVYSGTRKLHSSVDCFRGLGYTVNPAPALLDRAGAHWSCFSARQGVHRLRIRERIAERDGGRSWTDVSAWFWSAVLQQSRGPWLAMTIVESEE